MSADHNGFAIRRPWYSAATRASLAMVLTVGAFVCSFAVPASALTPNEKYVTRLYVDFLGWIPTQSELTWGSAVLAGHPSRAIRRARMSTVSSGVVSSKPAGLPGRTNGIW